MSETQTFETIVARLEAIAGQLESGEVPLEQALALFEEGVALSKQGGIRLDDAESRLEVLLSQGQTQPLEAKQASADGQASLLEPGSRA